jgi:hypothetical protein
MVSSSSEILTHRRTLSNENIASYQEDPSSAPSVRGMQSHYQSKCKQTADSVRRMLRCVSYKTIQLSFPFCTNANGTAYVLLPPQPILQSASGAVTAPCTRLSPQTVKGVARNMMQGIDRKAYVQHCTPYSAPARVKFWEAHEAMQLSIVRAWLSGSSVWKTRP